MLPILTYHNLDDADSPVAVSPRTFERQLDQLAQAGYAVLPLTEALAWQKTTGTSARRVAAITFDDGYASVVSRALPALTRRGWRATIFPVADYVGRTNVWPSQPASVPRARLLDWDELGELANLGWEIGGHSRTHPDLTLCADLSAEVFGAKLILEERFGRPVRAFAYPYGQVDRRVRAVVGVTFAVACTTDMRVARPTSDPLELERLDMWYFSRGPLVGLLGSPAMGPYVELCRVLRRQRPRLQAVGRGLASQLGINA